MPSTSDEGSLPGTRALQSRDDWAARMVGGIRALLDRDIERYRAADRTPGTRAALARRIGAVDARPPEVRLELLATTESPSLLAQRAGFDVHAVRWPALPGVDGEGLLLRPRGRVRARVVAVPDVAQSPEAVAGLGGELPASAQFARVLAEAGCEVVVPVLIDRRPLPTGISHREYVYRMAFELGRHIIGFEAQKILAVIDHFARTGHEPVGVYGYGEGGQLALYAGALDERIAAVGVSGHFRDRSTVWTEPIDRDVWRLFDGFGDAELASLVAPRSLVVETAPGPTHDGHEAGRAGPSDPSSGRLDPIPAEAVDAEVRRARAHFAAAGAVQAFAVEGPGPDGTGGVAAFLAGLCGTGGALLPPPGDGADAARPVSERLPNADERHHRQFRQLCDHLQALLRRSAAARDTYWAAADPSSPDAWRQSTAPYRERFHGEVIGRLPAPSLPPNPRTRLVYDRPGWTGHELALDLWPGVFAYGILLLPRDLSPGERRPVVVCQHGLEGLARDVVEGVDTGYRAYAARIADRGYVVYAPQNPYVGRDAFRVIQRKAHPLGLSLFAFIVAQHARTLEWLSSQPWADADRIALYGISYGGKTAMRVPALLSGYCLSICSADFNEWVYKCAGEDRRFSYLFGPEYDMYEWDLAHTCNYAEMASLIAPRPFMVERGHDDGVGVDEWVAFEYAKVRRLYAQLGIADRTEIEFFAGGHQINAAKTFAFLDRHLGGPFGSGAADAGRADGDGA